jgi:hypothetical protein
LVIIETVRFPGPGIPPGKAIGGKVKERGNGGFLFPGHGFIFPQDGEPCKGAAASNVYFTMSIFVDN